MTCQVITICHDSHIYTKEEGANAIVGLDMETSDMGGEASYIILVSATGTAVIVEEE